MSQAEAERDRARRKTLEDRDRPSPDRLEPAPPVQLTLKNGRRKNIRITGIALEDSAGGSAGATLAEGADILSPGATLLLDLPPSGTPSAVVVSYALHNAKGTKFGTHVSRLSPGGRPPAAELK